MDVAAILLVLVATVIALILYRVADGAHGVTGAAAVAGRADEALKGPQAGAAPDRRGTTCAAATPAPRGAPRGRFYIPSSHRPGTVAAREVSSL